MSDAMVANADPAEGDVTDVVEAMQKNNVARASGPYSLNALLGDDAPPPPEPPAEDEFVAETVDPVRQAPPGLTPRGWSPEVTARHPELVAATIAELAGAGGAATAEPIDPTDSVALAQAQAALGSKDVIKTILRNAAVKLNYQRLVSGMAAAGFASPAAQAAFAELVAEVQGGATEGGAPAPAPTPPPAPTPEPEPTP